MRWIPIVVCSVALAGSAAAVEAQARPAKTEGSQGVTHLTLPPVPQPLLPPSFAGWTAAVPPRKFTDPAQADASNAAALKEYDFVEGATATYRQGDDTLSLRLLRFQDDSGAYGAYSFYRPNGWSRGEIGTGAASSQNRVLFWLGDTLVDASFSRIGPMSAAQLRELASHIPVPRGIRALAPPILGNLPRTSLASMTTHYALGPAGYAGAGGVLPPGLVGFDRGAETVTANYNLPSGVATLTIINYPTPQMAAAQESAIRAYIQAGAKAQPSWPKPLQDSDQASLEVRRSGPLVALVSGDAIPDESHKLLDSVNYQADLTSIPLPAESEVARTSRFLMGIAALVLIGVVSALFLGFSLGGGRALYRIWHGKPASSLYEMEFISLNLRDWQKEKIEETGPPHPKS